MRQDHLRPRSIARPLLIVSVCACGPGDEPGDAAPDAILTATVDFDIGTIDGPEPYVFGRIVGITGDSAGRIYVADAQSSDIRAYDAEGEYLFTIGRQGSGPGEIQGGCCLAIDAEGRLWVRDTGNGRYNRYRVDDRGAEFLEQRRMSHGASGRWAETTFDHDGNLIDVGSRLSDDPDVDVRVRYTLGRDSDVLHTEEIPPIPADSLGMFLHEFDRGVIFFSQPFGSLGLYAQSPHGSWARAASGYDHIEWSGFEDRSVLHIATGVVPAAVSPGEHARAESTLVRRLQFPNLTLADLPWGIPDEKAPLRYLHFDRAGRLWVEVSVTDTAPRRAYVYEETGERAAIVEWPAEVNLNFGYLDPPLLLGVAQDELGVQRVVRMTVAGWETEGIPIGR